MTLLVLRRRPPTRRVVRNACIRRAVRAAHVRRTQHTFPTLDDTHTLYEICSSTKPLQRSSV